MIKRFKDYSLIKENVDLKSVLKYTIPNKDLDERGYTYQELFNSNIPYYSKEVGDLKVWCRVDNNEVYIKDYYDFLTPFIIEYYKNNRSDIKLIKHSKTFGYDYIPTKLNRSTGVIKSIKEIREEFGGDIDLLFDSEYYESPWEDLVYHLNEWDIIINEINYITK